MKKIYLGSNNKMNMGISETRDYLTKLSALTKDICRDDFTLFFIPSYTTLTEAVKAADGIVIGAQNMCWEEKGQFTGEISPLMLQEVGVTIVEIGHSERRHVFYETDAMANKKVDCALKHGFKPLLCIGETGEQKDDGISNEILRIQLIRGLKGINSEDARNMLVAYEPVWAIGVGGTPASAEYAQEKHKVIKDTLREILGEAAEDIPVLYGGSVNNGNAAELASMPDVDGLFIGRSAWDPDNFNTIIREVLPILRNK